MSVVDTSRPASMASGDMISVDIDFTSFQGGIKEQTFKGVRIPQSCCIRDLKDHLKLSKGITGRISVNEKELSNNKTLNVLGIVSGTVLDMKSFTPAKQYTHSILVKRVNGTVISVQVHSGTTTGGLKHILQDKIGMPVEEQVLEYDDGMIVQDKKRVVEICVHKKQIVLKSRKFTLDSTHSLIVIRVHELLVYHFLIIIATSLYEIYSVFK